MRLQAAAVRALPGTHGVRACSSRCVTGCLLQEAGIGAEQAMTMLESSREPDPPSPGAAKILRWEDKIVSLQIGTSTVHWVMSRSPRTISSVKRRRWRTSAPARCDQLQAAELPRR